MRLRSEANLREVLRSTKIVTKSAVDAQAQQPPTVVRLWHKSSKIPLSAIEVLLDCPNHLITNFGSLLEPRLEVRLNFLELCAVATTAC